MKNRLGPDVYDHQFRRIVNARNMVQAQAAADDHGSAAQLVLAAGKGGKEALMRGQKSIDQARNAYLSSVGMAGYNKVKAAVSVVFGQFRPVGQQDGIDVVICVGTAVPELFLPASVKPYRMMGIGVGVRVIHPADQQRLVSQGEPGSGSGQDSHAMFREHFTQGWHFTGPLFVVA